ncbi:hypothetical protein Tco_0263290, partial [Tanacetum coccineum]
MVSRLPKTGWYSFSMFLLDEKWLVQEGTALGKGFKDWKLMIFDVATSTNSAVSFDAAVLDGASTVSAVCIC